MKKIIVILVGIFLLYVLWSLSFQSKTKSLKVGNATLSIEIADTPEKRSQGLSDRKSLCENCGLLFIFKTPGIYPFWMRRMYFDIDILWISNGEVVDITYGAKVPPKEELGAPKTFYRPNRTVDQVLEVNAGWVKEKGIKVGEKVIFKD